MHLPYRRISTNRCRRNGGNRKSSLNRHVNTCTQDPLMNVILGGESFKEKQDICIDSND